MTTQEAQNEPQSELEARALWADLDREERGLEDGNLGDKKVEGEEQEGEENVQTVAQEGDPQEPEPTQEPEKPTYVVALERQLVDVTNALKATTGRVAALQSHIDKAVAAQAPTKSQIDEAAKKVEKWAALKEEFPDWAEGIEEYLDSKIVKGASPEDILAGAKKHAMETADAVTIKAAKDIATLAEADWEAVVSSEPFQTWLSKGPADYVQAAVAASAAWDAPKIVGIVRDFKKTQTNNPARATNSNQSRLASATVPTGSNASKKSTAEGEAYWKQLAAEESRLVSRGG